MARQSSMQQSLVISLIIFVTLTFILLIVTYFAFSQGEKLRLAAEEATRLADAANRDLNAAKAGLDTLRGLIGVGNEETDATKIKENIEAEISKSYPEFNEDPKTLLKLVGSLRDNRLDKDDQLKKSQEDVKKAQSDRQAALDKQEAAEVKAKQDVAKKAEEVADLQKKNLDISSEFKKTADMLSAERDQAQQQADAMTLLMDEIKKGEKEVGENAFEKLEPVKQVQELIGLIRKQKNQIKVLEQIEILRTVAGANPKIQRYVLQAIGATAKEIAQIEPLLRSETPPASQEIDGRVIAIDASDRTVVVEAGFTFGVRPGMVLQVFSAATPTSDSPGELPARLSAKGAIEVVALEGSSGLRCRISEESLVAPILVGDYVATPLWQGGRRLDAVVVGFVDMDGDSRDDRDRLEKLIRMAGGNVSESVGDSTTLIVDGSGGARAEGRQGGRVKIDDDVMKRRTDQLSRARAKNIPRTSVEEIRYWLGDLPQQPSTSSESFAVPTLPPQPSAVGR